MLADIMDAADAGVCDLPGEADLFDQPPAVDIVRDVQDLERDRQAHEAVIRVVDLAHAAAPDHPLDAIAAGDDCPRR